MANGDGEGRDDGGNNRSVLQNGVRALNRIALAIENLVIGGGGTSYGNTVVETGAGPFVVAAGTGILILNKGSPSATAITLGPAAARSGLPLYIYDFGNNAGDVVITPDVGDTGGIMGYPTWTFGTGGSLMLRPSSNIAGWLNLA